MDVEKAVRIGRVVWKPQMLYSDRMAKGVKKTTSTKQEEPGTCFYAYLVSMMFTRLERYNAGMRLLGGIL
jgi:hypothetical protein